MWTCKVCGAQVDDDAWQVCWQCSSPRSLEGPALEDQQRKVEKKRTSPVKCLRCGHAMRYGGTKKFHEGSRQWGFWLGDLGELFVHREYYDVYACPHCGKIELFVDGVGDDLRGETESKARR